MGGLKKKDCLLRIRIGTVSTDVVDHTFVAFTHCSSSCLSIVLFWSFFRRSLSRRVSDASEVQTELYILTKCPSFGRC